MGDSIKRVQEYNGYKVGDKVISTRYPDEKLGYGKINSIFEADDPDRSHFSFMCEMCGSYRLAYFKDIITEPTKSQSRAVERGRLKISGAKIRRRR